MGALSIAAAPAPTPAAAPAGATEQRSYIPPHMRGKIGGPTPGGPPAGGPPPMNGGINGSAWAAPAEYVLTLPFPVFVIDSLLTHLPKQKWLRRRPAPRWKLGKRKCSRFHSSHRWSSFRWSRWLGFITQWRRWL